MTDPNTIRAYGSKDVQTTAGFYGGYIKSSGNLDVNGNANIGTIISNNIHSNGNIDASGQVYEVSSVVSGWGCSPNGLQGRSAAGAILSCVNGVWSTSGGKPNKTFYTYTNYNSSFNYYNIGQHDVCVSIYGNENDQNDTWRDVEQHATYQWRITVKNSSETALCLDW